MNFRSVALVASVVVTVSVVAACTQDTSITSPRGTIVGTLKGAYRTNLWRIGGDGLEFVEARVGAFKRIGGGAIDADSGHHISTNEIDVAKAKESLTYEQLSAALVQTPQAFNSLRSNESKRVYTPRLKNGRNIKMGTVDGHALSIDVSSGVGKMPGVMIVNDNGRAVSIRRNRFQTVGKKTELKRSVSTVLDSTGKPAFVIETELDYKALEVGALDRLRFGADLLGNALVSFIQPDALGAQGPSDEECAEAACYDKFQDMLTKMGIWSAAMAALAGALALCASSPVDPAGILACAGIPWFHMAALAADVAFGAAVAAYWSCVQENRCRRDTTSSTGGGGGGGAGEQCYTIYYYESIDGGPWVEIGDSGPICEPIWEM